MGALRGLGGDLFGAWTPARGAFAGVAFPWGGGELAGHLELARHGGRAEGPGDLDEARALVGWGRRLPLPGPFALRLGGELGIDYFRLPRPDNPLETEAMAGLRTAVEWRPAPSWSVSLGVQRHWTFTEPVLRRDAVTLGVGRSLGLPRAARAALTGSPPEPTGASPLRPDAGRSGEAVPGAAVPAALPAPLAGPHWLAVLSDLPGWITHSVDGVSVGAAPPGSPSTLAGRVAVRIDGWELPLELLGALAPDRLPVEIASVESVEVTPATGTGRPGVDAVLEIGTRPVRPGLEAGVRVHGANATGDGGPRVLVAGEGPNVESLEWGYGFDVSWGSRGSRSAAVRAEGSHRRRWVSELPTFFRHFEAVDPDVRWPWIELRRGRVAAALDVGPLRHEATVAASRMDDFFLLPGLPREVPAAASLAAAWLRGAGSLGAGWSLGYGLGRTRNALQATPNRLGRDLDWTETVSTGRVTLRRSGVGGAPERATTAMEPGRRSDPIGPFGRAAGGGVAIELQRRTFGAAVPLSDTGDGRASIEADVRIPLGASLADPWLALAASAMRLDGRWGGTVETTVARADGGSASGLRLAAEAAPPAARGGFWLAEARGLGLLERWGLGRVDAGEPLAALRRGTLEAWHRRGGAGAWAEVRGRVDRARGWWLPRVDVRVTDRVPTAAGPLRLAGDAGGALGAVAVRYGWIRGSLEGSGSHTVRGVLDGDGAVREAHASLPRHRSVHHLRWRPLPDLALGARLEARSRTLHQGFPAADPLFPGTLPGGAWLDVGATKGVLAGRAALEVVIRDVLDRELPLHPLAGTPGLTLEVLARLRLGPQPSGELSSESRRR